MSYQSNIAFLFIYIKCTCLSSLTSLQSKCTGEFFYLFYTLTYFIVFHFLVINNQIPSKDSFGLWNFKIWINFWMQIQFIFSWDSLVVHSLIHWLDLYNILLIMIFSWLFLFVLIKITFVYTHSFVIRFFFLLVGISMSVFYSYILFTSCWRYVGVNVFFFFMKCILHVKMGGVVICMHFKLSNFFIYHSIFFKLHFL